VTTQHPPFHNLQHEGHPVAVRNVRERLVVLTVCGLLLLAVMIVFGQTAWHGFVNYDDPTYVTENNHVNGGFSWTGASWAMTAFYASNWHPLTWFSHMLDCQLYGLNAGGHHITNVLLHAAAAILLFLSLRRMTGTLWPSAWVAAIFAIHPLRAESVAWVAERKDVLSGLFFMLTLWLYARYVERPGSWGRYAWVVISFALGLMAKPMLVTLPFVLLLLDYWPLHRLNSEEAAGRSGFRFLLQLVIEKIPLFLLSAAVSGITIAAQKQAIVSFERVTFFVRLENATIAYVGYLGKMLFPINLAVMYPLSEGGPSIWQVLGAAAMLLAISFGVFRARGSAPYLLVGWLWYLGMMVPVIGVLQVGSQSMADRYTYLSQIGPTFAIAWAVVQVTRRWADRREILWVSSTLILAALLGTSWWETGYWRNSEALWNHTLEDTSQNSIAHYNLGVELAHQKRWGAAMDEYRKALEIRPNYAEAYLGIGMALNASGRIGEAISNYQMALQIKPNLPDPHINIGNLLADRGQIDEAIGHYQQALEIKPESAEAANNLGTLLAGRGRMDEAIARYRQALKANPNYADAYNNLGAALVGRKQIDEAIDCFRQSVRINPDNAFNHFNLGIVLARNGNRDEALEEYWKALGIAASRSDENLLDAIQKRISGLTGGKGR
jgi:tetratricopeptide (TPR) repeat protein